MSVEAKLSRLSTDLKNTQSPHSSGTSLTTHPETTPESWDDDILDDHPVEAPGPSLKPVTSNDSPAPPPPTPVSPHDHDSTARRWDAKAFPDTGKPSPRLNPSDRLGVDRRPEKTTATANRMIAGALGIKAPKKTEEQKQYDKAMREAEVKRKNREKEQREQEKLEDEQAKAAMWDG